MTNAVLPQNVQEFVRSEAGSHLMLLMLENAFGHSIQQIPPRERAHFEQEYGCDSSIELDLELLLNHLSRIRVAADLNGHAEDCLISYRGSEDSSIFLVDARRYVMDALRIAPREHPELARAYKNLACLYLARKKARTAMVQLERALVVFQKVGQGKAVEELLEIVSSRSEVECQEMRAKVELALANMGGVEV